MIPTSTARRARAFTVVARLRPRRTDEALPLLKTEMEAGHGGPSRRDRRWRDIAFQYGFLVDLARTADQRRLVP